MTTAVSSLSDRHFQIQKLRQDTVLPSELSSSSSNWSFNQNQMVKPKADHHRPLMVILDTNIFIGNLNQIKTLEVTYSEKITFVVPWAVLQELDRMKMKEYVDRQLSKYDCASKSLYDIMQKAQQSIFYISRLLELNSRYFYFESAAEVSELAVDPRCLRFCNQLFPIARARWRPTL